MKLQLQVGYAGPDPEPVEAPPEWWWDLFAARQRRARDRIGRVLRRLPGSMTEQIVAELRGAFERVETEHALATLAADGEIVGRRHGEAMTWRLAGSPDRP